MNKRDTWCMYYAEYIICYMHSLKLNSQNHVLTAAKL